MICIVKECGQETDVIDSRQGAFGSIRRRRKCRRGHRFSTYETSMETLATVENSLETIERAVSGLRTIMQQLIDAHRQELDDQRGGDSG